MMEQLEAQRESRREAIKKHKATRMEVRVAAENIVSNTPAEPTRLPTKEELNGVANLEDSREDSSLASDILGSEDVPADLRPTPSFEEAMAALKTQRAARKQALREHKRTAASCKLAQQRTTRRSAQKVREATGDAAD